jgi:RND family efflux transporter MFP subunit
MGRHFWYCRIDNVYPFGYTRALQPRLRQQARVRFAAEEGYGNVKVAWKIMWIVVALAILAGIMGYLAGFFETRISADFKGVVPESGEGESVVVELTTEPLIEQAPGTVRAKVETVISPLVTATISSIAVRAGDEAQAGDVLIELDVRELKARVDQMHQAVVSAQARLAQAEKEAKRVRRIRKADPGAVSKAELDRKEAALRTAQAEVIRARRQKDEAKTAMSYGTLIAPISGRVVERYADPGDAARQGEPLLRMYDPSTLRLEASVRESVASKLTKGRRLSVKIDALARQYESVVDEIVPSADPGSRSFLVKVSFGGGSGLYPGMFGRLLIPIGKTNRVYIPARAVTRVGQLAFVLVKSEQGPVRRYVRPGARTSGERVEIISGLTRGEVIIIPAR